MRNIATTLFLTVLLCLFATTASAKSNRTGEHKASPHKGTAHKHPSAAAKNSSHKKLAHKQPHTKAKTSQHHQAALHKPTPANAHTSSAKPESTLPAASPQNQAATAVLNYPIAVEASRTTTSSQPKTAATETVSPATPDDKTASAQTQTVATEGNSLMDAMKQRAETLFVAMGLLGTPYKTGGITPQKGMDCSGLVHYVYKQSANLDLPHSAKALSQNGAPVAKDDLQPGDLVFFHSLRKRFSHVGIYAGDGKFVHADSHEVKKVMVSSIDAHYWAKHFDGARRLSLDTLSK
jgi:cell wall-associated NlpC family hydrolase